MFGYEEHKQKYIICFHRPVSWELFKKRLEDKRSFRAVQWKEFCVCDYFLTISNNNFLFFFFFFYYLKYYIVIETIWITHVLLRSVEIFPLQVVQRLDCSRIKKGKMASIFYRCSSLVQMFKFSLDSAALYFYEQTIF